MFRTHHTGHPSRLQGTDEQSGTAPSQGPRAPRDGADPRPAPTALAGAWPGDQESVIDGETRKTSHTITKHWTGGHENIANTGIGTKFRTGVIQLWSGSLDIHGQVCWGTTQNRCWLKVRRGGSGEFFRLMDFFPQKNPRQPF